MKTLWGIIRSQWRDSANLVLGIWLACSPWILQYREIELATWNALMLGVIVTTAALAALLLFHEWEEWASLLFGAWLTVSPWVLAYTTSAVATWNHVLVGFLIGAMAAWSTWDVRHHPIPTT